MQQRHEFIEPVEALHGQANHVHQLATLFVQVNREQLFEVWIKVEQAAVEKRGGGVRDWLYLLKAGLH